LGKGGVNVKKMIKIIIPFLLVFGFVFSTNEKADAAFIATKEITGNTTYITGTLGGKAKVCLRSAGSDWGFRPVVSVVGYVQGTQMAPGDCLKFNVGATTTRTYEIFVSRPSLLGTFYFDLYEE